jgi:hypothetical protein
LIFGFLGLLCWALVVAHLFAKRVYSMVVAAARDRPARAAAVAAGLQLAGLLAFALPGGAGGYRHVRADFGEIGADRRAARAAAWAAGPVAVLGVAAVLSSLVATFGA